MELLRPRKIITNANPLNAIISVTSNYEYHDLVFDVKISKKIQTIFGEDGSQHIEVSFDKSKERIDQYASMQALLKNCVDNAEYVKNTILEMRLHIEKPQSEDDRQAVMKMDFMALKQWFMDYVRKEKLYMLIEQYNSTRKLKPFSKSFNAFVLDRNKYTHGLLCFSCPKFEFRISYIETPSQQHVYAHVDKDIIISYNNFYKEIIYFINTINEDNHNKLIGKMASK